jgi:uncharacterized protein (TIGR02677 family)
VSATEVTGPPPERTEPDQGPGTDAEARLLFRYVTVEEWRDYRAVVGVFAGTFFREFTPDEVAAELAARGHVLAPNVVTDRLDQLVGWGNLTVSASVGNPSSLADYYRRRSRYLITRAGQEVHEVVEGVLARVDEVRDVSVGRLGALRRALERLSVIDVAGTDPAELADAVRAVFDPHRAFTTEITQFFAAINQWQSRYDLDADELRFFAEVLVGYVGERLGEIERLTPPISRALAALDPALPAIIDRARGGLAARVDEAGIAGVTVVHTDGSARADWDHLGAWFRSRPGVPSRLEQLGRDAVAAVATLTQNLTRLSRVGLGATSRRADLLRLAAFLDGAADEADCHRLAAAAFGLHAPVHLSVRAGDAEDPVPATTAWADAPRAPVPVSLRERGETTNRGRPSPLPDRDRERRLLRERRAAEDERQRRADAELAALAELDGARISDAALARLEQLVGRALAGLGVSGLRAEASDGALAVVVVRKPGGSTTVTTPSGTLRVDDLAVEVLPAPTIGAAGEVDR